MHSRMSQLAAVAAFIIVAAQGGPARAVVTATLSVESYQDFDKGEAEAAFITSLGEVRPGWDTKRTELDGVGGVWSSVRASDGTLYVGTDDGGAIYRVAKDKTDKLVAIESAVAIASMAQGADGALYAGTMPAGEVWRVDATTGKATKLATLDGAESVWALAVDPGQKTLYAGTGPEGKLFAVDLGSGKASAVFASEDKRVTAVMVARDGSVWLGTSEEARVFRYDPKTKRARAIADFVGNEISALADAGTSVIASVNDFEEPITSGVKTKAAVDKAEKKPDKGEKPKAPKKGEKPGAEDRPSESSEPKRERARKGTGTLYRVHGDGRTAQLHALTATYFTQIAVTEDGQIFAGAGDKGRVYLVDTDGSVSTALDVDERIIAALYVDKERSMTLLTSDAAAAYQTTGTAKKASYTSDVFDTEVPSRFGKIVWHGRGSMKLETRSGNTSEPGIGWSDFAAPQGVKAGGGMSQSGRITSPSGRYVQFRVTFQGDAALSKARIYYLPYNRPTEIESIEVKPASENKGVTLGSGAIEPRSPVLELKWKVENPDEDTTRYRLEVRREGDALWTPIATEKRPFVSTKYSWNTETFPDGYYRLRVTALDDRSNSSDRALSAEKITPLFLVDNQKPRIDGVSVDYPRASARAVDSMSAIAEMAYSVDNGPWRVGASNDSIFDESTEILPMELPKGLEAGVHTLAIRVADEAGNIGATTVTFRVAE